MNLFTKSTAKLYSFLVINTTHAFDNSLRFRKNLIEKTWKLIITIDDEIGDEKMQHDITRDTAKILVLSSGKIDKYEHLIIEEIFPPDQSRMIEQTKFTHFLLYKAFEKQ